MTEFLENSESGIGLGFLVLGISWPDRVSNENVLEGANTPSVLALLSQRRLHWLGHVRRMEDGHLPNGMPSTANLRQVPETKDVCKRDMKSAEINRSCS